MHIVLIHRYFWPDTPLYAALLKDLALALGEEGHRVTVLTAQPSYTGSPGPAPRREQLAPTVEVRRVGLLPESRRATLTRLPNMAVFAFAILARGLRLGRIDAVMAATSPPVVAAFAGSLLARLRGARFVFHNQDIYPDVAVAAGLMRFARTARALRAIDATSHRRAHRTVVLSGDMARTVRARGVPAGRIRVINNFDPWAAEFDAKPGPAATDGPLTVAFVGNLGRFQNLGILVRVAERLRNEPGVVFDVIGDGPVRADLEREAARAGLDNLRFRGYWPAARVEEYLATAADLGIVTVMPGMLGAAFPSKTFSYLRHGCPVLAMVESDTDLAHLIGGTCGFQIDPGDEAAMADVISSCAADPGQLVPMRTAARDRYRNELSRAHRLRDWMALFEEIDHDASKGGIRVTRNSD